MTKTNEKTKWSNQRDSESFAQWQERLADRRAKQSARMARVRASLKTAIIERAELLMSLHGTEQVSAVTAAIDAVIPVTRRDTRAVQDIRDSLTLHFSGFSRAKNVYSEDRTHYVFQRVIEQEDIWRSLAHRSKADIFSSIRCAVPDRHYRRFVPSGLEVFTQTERLASKASKLPRAVTGCAPSVSQEIHWQSVTASLLGHSPVMPPCEPLPRLAHPAVLPTPQGYGAFARWPCAQVA